MALTLNDVLTLGKMGFTKTDIAALMGAQPSTPVQTTPAQVPGATAPAVQTVPNTHMTDPLGTDQQAPGSPDLGQLVASLADLSKKVDALNVPSAGFVGNPAPVTSVEDIILGAYQPNQADAPAPDFMKGVNK
jgi:hypothetical protein|nr:MAG TPA: hypothetical protein [Caudoviricetes sp.]